MHYTPEEISIIGVVVDAVIDTLKITRSSAEALTVAKRAMMFWYEGMRDREMLLASVLDLTVCERRWSCCTAAA